MSAWGRAAAAGTLLRRSHDAQRAYLAGLERLTADHLRTMRALLRGAGESGQRPLVDGRGPGDPAIVLEGVVGAAAASGFLVENHLDHPISAPVRVSPFVSARGRRVDVRLQLDPEVVTLGPREQLLVRVGTRIDAQLSDAGGYWGRLGVPELPGTELVVLVRVTAPAVAAVTEGAP